MNVIKYDDPYAAIEQIIEQIINAKDFDIAVYIMFLQRHFSDAAAVVLKPASKKEIDSYMIAHVDVVYDKIECLRKIIS